MATGTKLPRFKGKPLIVIPNEIPQADFLGGEFGEQVNEEVQGKYGKFQAINKVRYSEGLVRGSTPLYVVAVNEVIRPEGLRTANQADLERVLRTNAFDLRGFYEDSALVLRSEASPNEYLARYLMEQIKARNPDQKMPVMIPLNSLELTEDSDSDYGLSFKLREDAEIVYASILNNDTGIFSSEDIDEKTGLPNKFSSKGRVLYTRSSGVSRLCLGGDLYLDSDYECLADSGDAGRVVVVNDAEGVPQNFLKEHLVKLQAERDKQRAEIQERYTKAEKILRGKN